MLSAKSAKRFYVTTAVTWALKKHVDGTNSCGKQGGSIDKLVKKKTDGLLPPSREDKEDVTKLSVEFVCEDMRSFETVHRKGFKRLARGLVDIGARSGRVDAAKLLPDPTTVSRNLTKHAEEFRDKLIPELRNQLTESNAAVTLDMWTDDYKKIGYLGVTFHCINKKWELVERVLCTAEWDSALRKTADNLKPAIIQALRKYNLDEFYSKLVYVTDRGSNIVAALRAVTRLSCAAHILSTVLHTVLGKKSPDDLFHEEVTAVIEASKSLVTYFKQTTLQNRLKKTLKACVETRWNSLHTMLDSILSQYDDVGDILAERGEQNRLINLSRDVLGDLVSFLARFRDATKALEASKTPTLHLTAVWIERLRTHLQPATSDSMALGSLKKKALEVLNQKLELHPLHKMAVFLHPKLKSLKLLPKDDVTVVYGEARRLVQGKSK